MSKADTWMPLYIGDYLADTMRLNTVQHGAYLLLLMEYWRAGPLPDDDAQLACIVKMEPRAWRAQAPAVRRFFTRGEDGLLHQKRADAELARAAEISGKRQAAARVRHGHATDAPAPAHGGANAPAHGHAKPVRMDAHARCRATITATEDSVPAERRGGAARGTLDVRHEFWNEGMATFRRMTGRTEAATRAFLGKLLRDLRDDCAVGMALIRQAEADRPGDPAAWLAAAVAARAGGWAEHPLSHAAQMRRVVDIFGFNEEEPAT